MENHIHNEAECAVVRVLFPLTLKPVAIMPSERRETIIAKAQESFQNVLERLNYRGKTFPLNSAATKDI